MRFALFAVALLGLAPAAQAQIVLQPPVVVAPGGYGPGYWRERREGQEEWRRRAEFREAEHRRWEWRRAHCVRDYRGEEFCRR
jgi:hypothetical protein